MKRIKKPLFLAAAVLAIAGSFAFKSSRALCENEQQYIYRSGLGYVEVSDDYYCYQLAAPPYCTYYQSSLIPAVYTVCKYGQYVDPN